jgi:hypothetical protein
LWNTITTVLNSSLKIIVSSSHRSNSCFSIKPHRNKLIQRCLILFITNNPHSSPTWCFFCFLNFIFFSFDFLFYLFLNLLLFLFYYFLFSLLDRSNHDYHKIRLFNSQTLQCIRITCILPFKY